MLEIYLIDVLPKAHVHIVGFKAVDWVSEQGKERSPCNRVSRKCITYDLTTIIKDNLATLNAPGNHMLDLLVVPSTVEDKHVKWGQTFPRAIKDHSCIELVL